MVTQKDLSDLAALVAIHRLFVKSADDHKRDSARAAESWRDSYNNAWLALAGAGLGELGSIASGYVGVPVTRYLRTGQAFPRYKKKDNSIGQTSALRDFIRQTINTLIRTPSSILLRNAIRPLVFSLIPQAESGQDSQSFEEDNSALNRAVLAAILSVPGLVPGVLLSSALEPVSRYFEYGSFYPTYVTGDDNNEIQHRITDDLLYGLIQSAPAVAGDFVFADRALKSIESRARMNHYLSKMFSNIFGQKKEDDQVGDKN